MSHSSVFVFLLIIVGLTSVYSQRPRPCQGLKNRGWGGRCFGTQRTLERRRRYDSCESISYNQTLNGCPNDETGYPEACCIDCYKLSGRCHAGYARSWASDEDCGHCPWALRIGKIPKTRPGSGCHCCKECRPKRACRGNGSRCITKNDPVYNPEWCTANGGTIRKTACKGNGCWCCKIESEDDGARL